MNVFLRMNFLILGLAVVAGCGQPSTSSAPSSSSAPTATPAAPMPTQAQASNPATERYIQEGIQHLKEADPLAAIRSFDEAIKQDPLNPRPYIILGQTYMRLNNYTRAVDSFAAASRIAPQRGDIFYYLAVNHGLLGNRDTAMEYAQKSVEIYRQQQDQENFLRSLALLQGLKNATALGGGDTASPSSEETASLDTQGSQGQDSAGP